MDKQPVNITQNLIKHFANYLRLELSLSDNSVEAYCHDVLLFLQYLENQSFSTETNAIKQDTIENFFAYLYDLNIGATSQARILSGLKSFWRYLLQENLAETDPTVLISSPTLGRHLPEVLTYEEIQKMIDSVVGCVFRNSSGCKSAIYTETTAFSAFLAKAARKGLFPSATTA